MALVNHVQKKTIVSRDAIVRFQIAYYCHMRGISISEHDLDCLSLLAQLGEQELTEFCERATEARIFGSTQSVRNALAKAEKRKLIIKIGRNRKRISISPELGVQTQGNILLDYKIIAIES